MGRLDGKVAYITGGASGMGRASALLFAREGASVVIGDIQEQLGQEVVQEISEAGGKAVFQPTDVTEDEQVAALVGRAVSEYGGLNIAFNNAGIGGPIGIEGVSVEEFDRAWAVLLRGVLLGVKHSVPELRKAGGGVIINTASSAGLRGLMGAETYSALKAGVINLTASLAQSLGPDKIRINGIAPGWIRTPLLASAMPGGEAALDRGMPYAQPYPKQGLPEDIANAALFLASDESEFVSGITMPVDGGFDTMALQRPEAMEKFAEASGGQGLGWTG